MLESALKFLKEIENNSYEAYIVGGFVRDYILGIKSNDIDIATNATPRDIKNIFEESVLPNEDYGSVTVMKWGIRFEVTTFRKDINYIKNRKPSEVEYINDLYTDLLRRDFTINSICMNSEGKIIDLLNGKKDIEERKIISIGDSLFKFEEDCLRILRAVRFATILGFDLDDSLIDAIYKKKHLLKELSYYRKKEELSKIFSSSNCKRGIKLLLELGLDKELELYRLNNILNISDLIGIWSVLNVVDKYPFTNSEKELIKSVNTVLEFNNLDPLVLYKYGLYVNTIAGDIKGIDRKKIIQSYNELVIKKRRDLDISSEDIMNLLDRKPGRYLNDIYKDLEHEVLYKKLDNNKNDILEYIMRKYGN